MTKKRMHDKISKKNFEGNKKWNPASCNKNVIKKKTHLTREGLKEVLKKKKNQLHAWDNTQTYVAMRSKENTKW